MVAHINNENIIINEKAIKGKYTLRKIAASLAVIGTIFVTGCGSYNNIDNNLNIEASQDEDLANYRHALKEYSSDATVNNRVNLVEAGTNLEDDALNIMKDAIKETLKLDDTDKITITRNFEGKVKIVVTDKFNIEKYTFYDDNIPSSIKNIMAKIDTLKTYKGNGENDAWKGAIKEYKNRTISLHNNLVEFYKMLDDSAFIYNENDVNNKLDDQIIQNKTK